MPYILVTPLSIHLLPGTTDHLSIAATHAKLLKIGNASAVSSCYHIIAAYCRCGATARAHCLFDRMDVVSWMALVSGYSSTGQPCLAVSLPRDMSHSGVPPNAFNFSTAISRCACLADAGLGWKVHARAEVEDYASDAIATALIDMYGKTGDVEGARALFDGMAAPAKNMVSWGSVLFCIRTECTWARGHPTFCRVQNQKQLHGAQPLDVVKRCECMCRWASRWQCGRNQSGFACPNPSARENRKPVPIPIAMHGASFLPESCSTGLKQPSVFCYPSIIVAAAKYGFGRCVLTFFNEMIDRVVQPNSVTLLGVMHVCSHSDLVDTGLHLLYSMQSKYGDMKGEMVGVHIELLALGFGLLVISKGMIIKVMKNQRMCCDCHDAFKLISGILERGFVLRDLNRFNAARQVTHASLSETSSNACRRQVKPPADTTHDVYCGDVKSCLLPADAA
ncbi:hypothetical protein VPH35_132905 [Triticum aestivum]